MSGKEGKGKGQSREDKYKMHDVSEADKSANESSLRLNSK